MQKQVGYLEQQKLSLADQDEQKKKEGRKIENKKRKMVNEYQAVAEATVAEKERQKKQDEPLKAEKEKLFEAE